MGMPPLGAQLGWGLPAVGPYGWMRLMLRILLPAGDLTGRLQPVLQRYLKVLTVPLPLRGLGSWGAYTWTDVCLRVGACREGPQRRPRCLDAGAPPVAWPVGSQAPPGVGGSRGHTWETAFRGGSEAMSGGLHAGGAPSDHVDGGGVRVDLASAPR